MLHMSHITNDTTWAGAEERFLSKGGPPNKKNEIWLIFKNFSSYIPNSKGGPCPPGPPGSAAPVYVPQWAKA